jgi:histidine triad (HIT) family protein
MLAHLPVSSRPAVTTDCLFCRIRDREVPAVLVLDEPDVLAFLDHRPLFPGHVLLIPRTHFETIADLPKDLVGPLFEAGQRLAVAVKEAMAAEGTFVAINNVVSQSVPHLHLHVVPRRRKDGLRGFFWPRQKYPDDAAAETAAAAIRAALASSG